MLKTFILLLSAHLFVDFLLQSDWILARKKKWYILVAQAALVTLMSAILLGGVPVKLLLVVFVSFLLFDGLKVYTLKNGIYVFIGQQLIRLLVIIVLAYLYPNTAQTGYWMTILSQEQQQWYFFGATLLCGFILCVPAGGVMIGILTGPLLEEIKADSPGGEHNGQDDLEGLRKGGRYIGWLERSMVMILLLIGEPQAIGFLFAAKSILRFGEIKDTRHRKMAEYIIIGTFLSFGWALLISYLTQLALKIWH
jgi:hypothetical protein